VDRLARNDTRSLDLSTRAKLGVDGTLTIDGLTKTIDDTAKKLRSDRNIDDSTSALDGVTFQDRSVITEDDNTDVGVLQVEGHTSETRGEDNHLTGLDLVQTVNTGNTVTNRDNLADLIEGSRRLR
jgi:hypothetical protein